MSRNITFPVPVREFVVPLFANGGLRATTTRIYPIPIPANDRVMNQPPPLAADACLPPRVRNAVLRNANDTK
jgi:hypothetical protein